MPQIPFLSSLIHYFSLFYDYSGRKIYLLICIVLFTGLSESFGISMLLPILDIDRQSAAKSAYTRTIYDFLEFSGVKVTLFSLIFLVVIAFLLKGLFSFTQKSIISYITSGVVKTLRADFCRKYVDMNYEYYTNVNIGYLNNIITVEINRATGALSRYIDVIVNIVFIIVYITATFIINWNMTLLVLGTSLFMFLAIKPLFRISRKLSLLVSGTNAEIQSLFIQKIYSFKYLKATNSFSYFINHIYKKIDENRLYNFKTGVINAISSSITEPVTVLFLSVLILYNVGYKGNTFGEIMVISIFFYKAFPYVFGLQDRWQRFIANIGGVEVLKKAGRDLDNNKESSGSYKIKNFDNRIELNNVNFSYGKKQILFDINMSIPKNRTIGIVGESGAGKTTLFDIFTGLVKPQSGKIYIDGVDYSVLDLSSLRQLFGYVTQEPIIFNDTIINNISLWEYGRDDGVCKVKIENTVELANCTTFIREAEKGYDTVIGDRGIKLSGGQRQRIAIARELFKEPAIMMFDEATSALDTESEMLIQKSINSMLGKLTIVLVAHRLSTIRYCDYIYVLKAGRIVEEGSFDKLYLDKNSLFYKMCQKQKLSNN